MDYRKLNIETWKKLDESGSFVSGYKSIWLALNDEKESNLHIFKDDSNQYHFAIETVNINKKDIVNPGINGLQVGLYPYKLDSGKVGLFIDLICNISSYLEIFTLLVKDIAKTILEDCKQPDNTVKQVINNWISFWSHSRLESLSEESQIGLICELITLNNLCKINPSNALKSWKGPLGEIHDFIFTDCSFEVKGTRKPDRSHTINGIDQLKSTNNKRLSLISFILSTSSNENLINLPNLIQSIINTHFQNRPDLIIQFNELLAITGYNPIHNEEYNNFNVNVLEATLFEINEEFPKLTSDNLKEALNKRITSVRYNISLEGLIGKDFNEIYLGDYFY